MAALTLLATPVRADEPPLRAVAGVFPPFVMQEDGKLTGFSIDLWNAVAARMERPTTIALVPDTASAFDALRYHEVRKGSGRVKVVGPEFRKSEPGFMVALDGPLRLQVDSALVALRADATYERLREKSFGRE